MKIVFIPHLPTLYGRRYNLAKNLAAQGHEVHFITWDMPYPISSTTLFTHLRNSLKFKTRKESENFFIYQVRRLPFFWPVINGLIFKSQIKQLCKSYGAEVIISQAFTNETEPPFNLPLVYDINDDHQAFADIYGSRLYKIAYKALGVKSVIRRQSQKAMLVTVVSDKLLDFAKMYNDNVVKIPNGVELEAIKLAKSNRRKTRQHSLLYVSNFGKWSRLKDLVGIVASLRDEYPDILLDIVGDGTELSEAKKESEKLGLQKHIKFWGKINDRKKIFKLISEADTCLNISEKNAFRDAASPIKVIEYLAFNKKIVSSRVAEVEKLHLANIFFFSESNKAKDLKTTIIKAFESKLPPLFNTGMIAENYSWEKLTKRLLSSIDNAVHTTQKTRMR